MKPDWLVILCVPLPILGAALAGQAIRKDLPRAAPVQMTVTGQGQGADGTHYSFTATVPLLIEPPLPIPTPTPTPEPLALSYLTANPAVVAPGGTALIIVVLTRAAGQPVQIALKSADPDAVIAPSMTIAAGQSQGTAAVTVAATITTGKLIAIVGTYNGQSRGANLTVRLPVPGPVPVPVPPEPLGPLTPQVDGITNPDGSPLTLPLVPGQAVRVFGSGFGAAAGELWGNGYPLPVVTWSDTEASGRLSWSCAALCVGVRTKEGGSYAGGVPDEPWAEAPGPEPPSSRRR